MGVTREILTISNEGADTARVIQNTTRRSRVVFWMTRAVSAPEFDIGHILRVSQVPEWAFVFIPLLWYFKGNYEDLGGEDGGVKVYSLNKSPYLNSEVNKCGS